MSLVHGEKKKKEEKKKEEKTFSLEQHIRFLTYYWIFCHYLIDSWKILPDGRLGKEASLEFFPMMFNV